ncbi:unnamed protein product [Rhizoctonia solani]|uniref:Laminin domain protein n=1 Tax=Rhizoctonia solani TaxID=456999 RepID=A0A8H2WGG7_9AGAM|nr:unnamed protein product [Rhizoctonia solani]
MADHEWYPPGQVCYPPELPTYLKHVHDLRPILGVPQDPELIGIHSVIYAANRVSGVPGMHDPCLFMKLSDHLFSVQMARYRSKHSLITFPSNATYRPPTLPTHVAVQLEAVVGDPSDEEIMKVQDAMRTYQNLSSVPSMFDPRVHMELSQHLFDIQMARHMRVAGEIQPSLEPQARARLEILIPVEIPLNTAEEIPGTTNNAGTGGNVAGVHQPPLLAAGFDVRDLMERSNQLAKQFNHALDRFTQLAGQTYSSREQSNNLSERFNQLLERFDQVVEQSNQSAQQTNQLAEYSNQLNERSNKLFEQLLPTLGQPNQLGERMTSLLDGFNQHLQRSNELSEKSNNISDQLNQLTERSNQLSKQASEPLERLEGVMKNINRVLVGVQHAIVRNHKGNSLYALDCLVNEAGEVPEVSKLTGNVSQAYPIVGPFKGH